MSEDDPLYLAEMLEAIGQIESYISGLDKAAFLGNRLIADAVSMNLLIIGEAANRLSNRLRQASSAIPWIDIIGLRHRIAHGYRHIDQDVVWDIVITDLPDLRMHLDRLTALSEGS